MCFIEPHSTSNNTVHNTLACTLDSGRLVVFVVDGWGEVMSNGNTSGISNLSVRALMLNKRVLDFVAYVMRAVSWIAFGPTERNII